MIERIQFRPGDLTPFLAARGATNNPEASQLAQRDLERYYHLLALALASVSLTSGQAGMIVDVLNGTLIGTSTAQLLADEMSDSLADGYATKWEVDGPALVATVRSWSLLQRMAVCDAVERFWSANHVTSTDDRLVAIGLVKRG